MPVLLGCMFCLFLRGCGLVLFVAPPLPENATHYSTCISQQGDLRPTMVSVSAVIAVVGVSLLARDDGKVLAFTCVFLLAQVLCFLSFLFLFTHALAYETHANATLSLPQNRTGP